MALAIRHEVDAPDSPVLVVSLEGWMDAGFAAQTAASVLTGSFEQKIFAVFPGDELIDYRARRPRLRIDNGVRGRISWPEPTITVGVDQNGVGIVFLGGPEPDYRWQRFSAEVADIAVELQVRLVVGLGAFPNAVPHTRPFRLASTSSNATLAETIGFVGGSLEVPSGIGDVIGAACSSRGIPSIGLWARVPHYIAAMPVPAAAVALLDGLRLVSGITLSTSELRHSAEENLRQIDELIANSDEHSQMVRALEAQFDQSEHSEVGPILAGGFGEGGEPLPTGDEIAAELERYLRGEV